MAAADIVTAGYGSFSTIYAIPTRGFGAGAEFIPGDTRGWVALQSRALSDVHVVSQAVTKVHLQSSLER